LKKTIARKRGEDYNARKSPYLELQVVVNLSKSTPFLGLEGVTGSLEGVKILPPYFSILSR